MTNLNGERPLCHLDLDRPWFEQIERNTRIGVRSAYCVWKHNKTPQWLASDSSGDINNSQRRESKMASWPAKRGENCNQGENQTKTEIIIFGNSRSTISLARTKEELDTVFHVPKATERLKDQTRYRLLVVEQKITLGKNKQTLYDKLLAQIEDDRRAGSDTDDTRDEKNYDE